MDDGDDMESDELGGSSRGEPAGRLSSIVATVSFPSEGGRGLLRSGWAFESRLELHDEEIEACARHLGQELGARVATSPNEFGGHAHSIHGRLDSRADALGFLRSAPIAFAALSAWGCGPADGFGPEPASPSDRSDSRMLAAIQSLALARDCPDGGEPARSPPRSRL